MTRAAICSPACRPPCSAGCASCGSAAGCSATSPTAKMFLNPVTRRSAAVVMRPPRPCGRPQVPTTFGTATPAAQTTKPAFRNSPLPSSTPSSRTSATDVFSRSSTPRSRSARAAYSRSVRGERARAPCPPSRPARCACAGGPARDRSAAIASLRSSASAPAISTPVGPAPTTTIARSSLVFAAAACSRLVKISIPQLAAPASRV